MARKALILLAAFCATSFLGDSARAQNANAYLNREARPVIAMAGAWDLVSADGARRCRLQFNRSGVAGEWMLFGMPPPCRMSFPQIGRRNGWALAADGSIHLGPLTDEPVLVFSKSSDAIFLGAGGLRLEAVGRSVHGEERSNTVAAATAQLAAKISPADEARARLAGNYGIARSAVEIGCTLTLTTTPTRISGAGDGVWVAQINGPCPDDGLKVFAPAGWRYENSRIFLIARKGHSIGFSTDKIQGEWVKDPPAGRPLLLRRHKT